MNKIDSNFSTSINNALELFEDRVFMHNQHELFVTEYSKSLSKYLESESHKRIKQWDEIIKCSYKQEIEFI